MKKYEIVRETPQYNKYIKWFYRSYHDDGSMICSLGFKTRREAQAFHDKQISKRINARSVENL